MPDKCDNYKRRTTTRTLTVPWRLAYRRRQTLTCQISHLPSREIARSQIPDFAGSDEVRESGERFLDGRGFVEAVNVEDVDIIRSETAEALLHIGQEVVSGQAHAVGIRRIHSLHVDRQTHQDTYIFY